MAIYLLDTNALSALMNEEARSAARAASIRPTDRLDSMTKNHSLGSPRS